MAYYFPRPGYGNDLTRLKRVVVANETPPAPGMPPSVPPPDVHIMPPLNPVPQPPQSQQPPEAPKPPQNQPNKQEQPKKEPGQTPEAPKAGDTNPEKEKSDHEPDDSDSDDGEPDEKQVDNEVLGGDEQGGDDPNTVGEPNTGDDDSQNISGDSSSGEPDADDGANALSNPAQSTDDDADDTDDDPDWDDDDSNDDDNGDEDALKPAGDPVEEAPKDTPIEIGHRKSAIEEMQIDDEAEDVKPLDPKDTAQLREDPIDTEEIKEIVDRAIDAISKGRGTGKSVLTNLIAKTYATQTDWRPILRKFLQKGAPRYEPDRSYRVPSRASHPLDRFMPSDVDQEIRPRRTIAVAIDTSGSVFNPKFLDRFFAEVFKIIKTMNTDVLMIMWTTDVYHTVLLTPKNAKKEIGKARLASGGTHISCVSSWFAHPNNKKFRKQLAGVVYITDLEVEHDPALVPGVPIAFFGPEELMNKDMAEKMKKKGYVVVTYAN